MQKHIITTIQQEKTEENKEKKLKKLLPEKKYKRMCCNP
jgi:hypothetical protein